MKDAGGRIHFAHAVDFGLSVDKKMTYAKAGVGKTYESALKDLFDKS